jgi:hypothetical protein
MPYRLSMIDQQLLWLKKSGLDDSPIILIALGLEV